MSGRLSAPFLADLADDRDLSLEGFAGHWQWLGGRHVGCIFWLAARSLAVMSARRTLVSFSSVKRAILLSLSSRSCC
ncbi:hypothetical protein MES5069_50025 [Mesorhizobium escarrei]|uniref:Uncharacterized protein n=1 Tax=Mesorhizobium escarrei TaxID=666018 RepID=A0ABM9E9K0_9HYPH|nr:hypothetical protein MES5069_50025 [Mesorhizobium escarrei]